MRERLAVLSEDYVSMLWMIEQILKYSKRFILIFYRFFTLPVSAKPFCVAKLQQKNDIRNSIYHFSVKIMENFMNL